MCLNKCKKNDVWEREDEKCVRVYLFIFVLQTHKHGNSFLYERAASVWQMNCVECAVEGGLAIQLECANMSHEAINSTFEYLVSL